MDSPTAADLLDEATAEYFQAVDRGQLIDETELLAKYPGCAAALEKFLAGERELLAACQQVVVDGAAQPVTGDTLERDERLGDFRTIAELGRGGMGVVYEAEQLSLGRRVALKILPIASTFDQHQVARFQNEARAAALLSHPHIVPVFAVGCDRGVHYIAMQRIVGRSLADIIVAARNDDTSTDALRRRVRQAATLGIQAADALAYSHERGVLHRDVKPSNLLVDDNGKLWITDFGVARIGEDRALTLTGSLIGTLRYMSPEQAEGRHASIDPRADVYSLGATLYELIALQPAITGNEPAEQIRAISAGSVKLLRQIDARIPADLETIVGKALRTEPADRYASAQALAADLRRFLAHEPIAAKPITPAERFIKWTRRRPALVGGVALAGGVLSLVLLISTALVNHARLDAQTALDATSELLYVSDMTAAYGAWENGWADKVRPLLDQQRPQPGRPDHRGSEWRLLNQLALLAEPVLLGSHRGSANGIVAMPDGQRFASVGDDGALRIWNAKTRTSQSIPVTNEKLQSLAISPDGRYVAVAGQAVYLVDLDNSTRPKQLTMFEHTVESLAFGPAGESIAAGVRYHEVVLLSLTGEVLNRLPTDSRVESLEFVPRLDGFLLATRKPHKEGRGHGIIQVWDPKLAEIKHDLHGDAKVDFVDISTAAMVGDSDWIFCGSRSLARAALVHIGSERLSDRILIGRDAVATVACSPYDQQIAVGYASGVVSTYAVQQQDDDHVEVRPLAAFQAHRGNANGIAFLPSGHLATAGGDGRVKLWTTRQNRSALIHLDSHQIYDIAISADGKAVVTAAADEIRFMTQRGQLIRRVNPKGHVSKVSWSARGDRLAACCEGPNIVLLYDRQGQQIAKFPTPGTARGAAFLDDDRRIAVVVELPEQQHQLLICDAADGRKLHASPCEGPLDALAVTTDHRLIAVGGRFEQIVLCSPADPGNPRRLFTGSNTAALAFSPDGSMLASGHGDSVIRLWNPKTGDLAAELVGHESNVTQLFFSNDGKTLFSGSNDGRLRLWSVPHRRPYGVLSQSPSLMDLQDAAPYRPILAAMQGGLFAILRNVEIGHAELTVWDCDEQ